MMVRAALAGSLAGLRLACLGSQPYNDTARAKTLKEPYEE